MGKFIIHRKSGFKSSTPVRIYDKRGLFYYCERPNWFNLPAGEYYVDGEIKRTTPRNFRKLSLPPREKLNSLPDPSKLKIYKGNHNHKAFIVTGTNEIIMSNEMMEQLTPQIHAIFLHELGHYYYKTEVYCDMFAFNKMIEYGYNPSQISFLTKTLSNHPANHSRKIKLLKKVTKR